MMNNLDPQNEQVIMTNAVELQNLGKMEVPTIQPVEGSTNDVSASADDSKDSPSKEPKDASSDDVEETAKQGSDKSIVFPRGIKLIVILFALGLVNLLVSVVR